MSQGNTLVNHLDIDRAAVKHIMKYLVCYGKHSLPQTFYVLSRKLAGYCGKGTPELYLQNRNFLVEYYLTSCMVINIHKIHQKLPYPTTVLPYSTITVLKSYRTQKLPYSTVRVLNNYCTQLLPYSIVNVLKSYRTQQLWQSTVTVLKRYRNRQLRYSPVTVLGQSRGKGQRLVWGRVQGVGIGSARGE